MFPLSSSQHTFQLLRYIATARTVAPGGYGRTLCPSQRFDCYILLFGCGWIIVLLSNYFYTTIALLTATGLFAALLNCPAVWLSRYTSQGGIAHEGSHCQHFIGANSRKLCTSPRGKQCAGIKSDPAVSHPVYWLTGSWMSRELSGYSDRWYDCCLDAEILKPICTFKPLFVAR